MAVKVDAVTGGLLGAAVVAFINSGFTFWNNRKAAPEITRQEIEKMQEQHEQKRDETMLNFWLEQVKRVEDKYSQDIQQIRDSAIAEKTSSDLTNSSLQTEMRHFVEEKGKSDLEFQKEIGKLREDFHINNLVLEKEKVAFMENMFTRYEKLAYQITGGQYNAINNGASSASGNDSDDSESEFNESDSDSHSRYKT